MQILNIQNKPEEKILRKKTEKFDFGKFSKAEVDKLVQDMRETMREANGIGLAANQIGLPYQVFVAEVEGNNGKKFYSVFNPKIEKKSEEEVYFEEGCLSVPGSYGNVERAEEIMLIGQDKRGKPVKIKAWGMLARVFQHEVDHLNGHLFLDRAKEIFNSEPKK